MTGADAESCAPLLTHGRPEIVVSDLPEEDGLVRRVDRWLGVVGEERRRTS